MKKDAFLGAMWAAFSPAQKHNIEATRIELLMPFIDWDKNETIPELVDRYRSGKLTREMIFAAVDRYVNCHFACCYINALESPNTPALWIDTGLEPWKGVAYSYGGA